MAATTNNDLVTWGVSRYQVRRWRRALGVPRFNPGTKALWVSLAESRLRGAAAKKARHG